jgi:hypothetical protein
MGLTRLSNFCCVLPSKTTQRRPPTTVRVNFLWCFTTRTTQCVLQRGSSENYVVSSPRKPIKSVPHPLHPPHTHDGSQVFLVINARSPFLKKSCPKFLLLSFCVWAHQREPLQPHVWSPLVPISCGACSLWTPPINDLSRASPAPHTELPDSLTFFSEW